MVGGSRKKKERDKGMASRGGSRMGGEGYREIERGKERERECVRMREGRKGMDGGE